MKQHPMTTAMMFALLQQDIAGGPINLNHKTKRTPLPCLRDDEARKAKAEAKRERRLARNRAMAALEKDDG